jgi:hypothetical protein
MKNSPHFYKKEPKQNVTPANVVCFKWLLLLFFKVADMKNHLKHIMLVGVINRCMK